MQSRDHRLTKGDRWHIDSGHAPQAGEEVTFRARIHAVRKMSAKLAFLVLRQQLTTIQGALHAKEGEISTHMVQWAESIPTESIVLVKGYLQHPEVPVTGCSVHSLEISIQELHVVTRKEESVPFTPYEAEVSKETENKEEGNNARLPDRVRLSNRIIDLRTTTSQAIFRMNSGVCNLFRSYLDSKGFVEIHTPKLQAGATESGASVFQLDYFGRPAFLAQSPQLAKQMSIAADFERVYEIGPVFRAENSNTHRHLTEYTGLDLEMTIEEHYHEALHLIDGTLKHIFQGIYDQFSRELEVIKRQFPHNDLVWLKETPRIPFADGVRMLRDSGWTDDDGNPPSEHEDLHTKDGIRLGELVKEKYKTDYYILDKFPASARPFYTMPDAQDDKLTNSFDIFLRGQEILTGGQRIHDFKVLEEKMLALGIDPASMDEYMEGFRLGAPPHAGAGKAVPQEIQEKCNIRIQDWQANRTGKQVHLPEIAPWRDMSHRRYFYAHDKRGQIHALVVLAQLAPQYGYQVKWALEFPGATSGTIEAITLHAINAAKASGTKRLTFGSAATSELHAVHNLGGIRVRMLQHTYQSIAKQFKLKQKGDFRQKLGAEEDALYICYPPYGLGVRGSKAIVDFFESDDRAMPGVVYVALYYSFLDSFVSFCIEVPYRVHS